MHIPANALEKSQIQKLSTPLMAKVAIIGAGLGVLAVAIALRKLGVDVQVYEKAQDFRPIGGGLGYYQMVENVWKLLNSNATGLR